MIDDTRIKRALDLANKAAEADRAGRYQEALDLYTLCCDNWWLVCKYEQNEQVKSRVQAKMGEYLKRAEQIKLYLNQRHDHPPQRLPAAEGDGGTPNEEDKLKKSLESAIVTDKPNVRWDDIAGLAAAKEALQETVIIPTRFPQLFAGKCTPWRGILLYGPPGTGKSYLAKACATEADATFYSISSSDLVSKWMGESEKLVRSLFEMARASKPAIIFIDEIDSMAGSRESGESDASRRIKTEFLVQMQGVGSNNDGILVLGATNTPWDLDAAIRRRFERRIYIPLPDVLARKRLFEIHIGDTPCHMTSDDYINLAQRTEGFSGADISVLVRQALFEPVRKCKSATHFKQVMHEGKLMWTPCSAKDPAPSRREMNLMDIKGDELLPPKNVVSDFEQALETCRPSVGKEDLVKQEAFTKDFGMEG